MTNRVLNHQYIGRVAKEGDVGLELEVEADRPLPDISDFWRSKTEGSLRGYSMEYVTNGPIPCDSTKLETIKLLTDVINRPEFRVNKTSPRTSLHVHVNVGKLTPNQTWTASTAYWLFENLLMEYCGESRKGNLFCLRAKDAEGSIRTCARDLRNKTPFTTLKTDIIRYAGQNMNAIPKFGSIEYRGMCGTTDAEIIDTWSTELCGLVRNASVQFKDPSELLDRYYVETNKAAFLRRFFNPDFVQRLTSIPEWQGLIESNIDLILEFAYYHSDWTKYQDRLEDHYTKNPVPVLDPSRIPLGVTLNSEQLSLAMESNYRLIRTRRGYEIPFDYNTQGLKMIDWECGEYLYYEGDEENCPHVPWETRTAVYQEDLSPGDHAVAALRLQAEYNRISQLGLNDPFTMSTTVGTTRAMRPLQTHSIATNTITEARGRPGDMTIIDDIVDSPNYPPLFDEDI